MRLADMPFCCTAAVLGSLGEHGEPSVVTVKEIQRLASYVLPAKRDLGGGMRGGHKRIVFAISVDPENIKMLQEAGFKIVDHYPGIQGEVFILTLHAKQDDVHEEGLV